MNDGRIFITEIIGKMAVRDGQLLGRIDDAVIDTSTGIVKYLVLETAQASEITDDTGRAVIPLDSMRMDQGYVIVSRLAI